MTIVTDKSLISSESRMYFLMKVRKIGSQNIAICGVYCHQEGLSMLDIKSKNISYLKSHQCKNVNNQISFNVFVKSSFVGTGLHQGLLPIHIFISETF